MIIALLNQKGGVGKTTLATHIAGELALRGQQVILLDADPQGSALDWTQRRSQQGLRRLFSAVGLARETLHQEAPGRGVPHPPRVSSLRHDRSIRHPAPPPDSAAAHNRITAASQHARMHHNPGIQAGKRTEISIIQASRLGNATKKR